MVVDALPWLVEAVRAHPLVGLGEMHGSATEHAFLRQLVAHDGFAADVVIEFGNALYQDRLDAYIGGDEVPRDRLRDVWRDTTQSPINSWEDPIYAELLATIREVNRRGRDIRVVAGDPPIDWAKVRSVEDWLPFAGARDSHYAAVVENEVLRRGRRALLLIGGMHLVRSAPASVGARFVAMPVVMPHAGYGRLNDEVEAVTSTWPVPSVGAVAGTALASFGMEHLVSGLRDGEGKPKQFRSWRWDELFDWYLYLGPAARLRRSGGAPSADGEFAAELERRRTIVHAPGGIPRLP